MDVCVKRAFYSEESTVGTLLINGVFECYTLELPEGKSIPVGTYPLVITHSPRFNRLMPRVEDVVGRSGILIHWGNTAKDTEGCILVGQTESPNFIGSSRKAFEAFYTKLSAALLLKEPATLTVVDARKPNVT